MTAPIAMTLGEPSGIGPDIALSLLQSEQEIPIMLFADQHLLEERAHLLGLTLPHHPTIQIQHIPAKAPCKPGKLNAANAHYVIDTLQQAVDACVSGTCRALVTGPIHKGIINEAGIPFTGHTEWLAHYTQTPQTVMMLATPSLRVALATTHLPLAEVPSRITEKHLRRCLTIIDKALKEQFHISTPRIAVCGLNPHAGEGGHMGREEVDIMEPCFAALCKQGLNILGPLSADTAFTEKMCREYDVILAMYHDQGLPVLKTQGFGQAVNITLGLPIIRTSVDHGVALDLAGTGQAEHGSLQQALRMATHL